MLYEDSYPRPYRSDLLGRAPCWNLRYHSGFYWVRSTRFHAIPNPAGYCARNLWNSLPRDGMDIRGDWPSMSLHRRVHSGDGLLRRQQKASPARRTPGSLRPRLRRIGVPVHVLRGHTAFGHRSTAFQYRDLHHGPDWPSASGWIANRALRPSLLGPWLRLEDVSESGTQE